MSAAEKRAARRARILQNSEKRLKIVTGEIPTKEPLQSSKNEEEKDAKQDIEHHDANILMHNPVVMDPLERRRDAIARRRKKEENVIDQMISTGKSIENSLSTERKKPSILGNVGTCRLQIRLFLTQEVLIRAVLIGFAITAALALDARSLHIDTAPEVFKDFMNHYRDQLSEDSIRQQFGDNEAVSDISESYSSLSYPKESVGGRFRQIMPHFITHPPLVAIILITRYTMTLVFEAFRKLFGNSAVPLAEEENLGFVLSMLLSNRPKVKGIYRMMRVSFDDVCLMLYCFCIIIAGRMALLP